MRILIQPATLLGIILAGYLFKRLRLFRERDYRVLQTAEFNLILPGAIIYSFATNPHQVSFLLLSAFAVLAALLPPLGVYLTTRRTPADRRAFLMLNTSGFNIGCFCFPLLQTLIGSAALVPAAMFDLGNDVMVAAGTSVMTQSLLHIEPGRPLSEQGEVDAPVMPRPRSDDPDVRRLRRKALLVGIGKGFFGSVCFDVYLLMALMMLLGLNLPSWVAQVTQPFSGANALVSMLMVGMLMELPDGRGDIKAVGQVLAWRLPLGLIFAVAAWFLLPFDPVVREAIALCCLSPTAIFATMFTDKVLGNARLAGFTLALTAVISTVAMVGAHLLTAAL
ncbi:auxin efflux carrier family transporter [Bifidobacterium actinocoloniiforme DSM 22766]|uniref:Auxin efflux carrier family transporter n=1 Tax=Bifidobacterium actinocoloniiforme DSM 22766 TaxID=1437605 RepID=A0A086YZC7_9BIFI|nr:permease [Bifidobacterium actinocoloniiforme]AKV54969.1 permease [Bifidobacterium actinocoloniiforme DSM 22766]KFI39627.1 auxin efflux carrier family transporter [Bifidobacterium actinocoloniiforme DSM 22766]